MGSFSQISKAFVWTFFVTAFAGVSVFAQDPVSTAPLMAPSQTTPVKIAQATSTATATTTAPATPADSGPPAPFAFGDFSWAPASYAPAESWLDNKYFVPEIRVDTSYHYDLSNPVDDTISGSSEVFRHNELQMAHLGVGGDLNYKNVGLRLMTQFGMYSTTTPRNDASPSKGQWDLGDAYRYISEGYATYHIDALNGINVQAGIFMSYIGLWSYYNFDNWTYQPSYVSSNTPWFFNGMRVQIFTSDKLKIEPWIINGWQSYGKFNNEPGLGMQILWKPTDWLVVLGNQYYGYDTLGDPDRRRIHTDDSVMVKYYENQGKTISKAAVSLTLDAGCENGDGVVCSGGSSSLGGTPSQYFIGFMAYNRLWFDHDHFGLTIGGGGINNPGRYLVLLPPINGATAATGTPYFTENPGDTFMAWDGQVTADWMPTRNVTFRLEYTHRAASVAYFAGSGGMTPPGAINGVAPDTAGGLGTPGALVPGWSPNLQNTEDRITTAMLVRL